MKDRTFAPGGTIICNSMTHFHSSTGSSSRKVDSNEIHLHTLNKVQHSFVLPLCSCKNRTDDSHSLHAPFDYVLIKLSLYVFFYLLLLLRTSN